MAPQPYSATGRMTFQIPVSSILHEIHIACNTVADSGAPGGYAIVGTDLGATHIDADVAAGIFWAKAKGLYSNAVTAIAWNLDRFVSGVFVPVVGGADTADGVGTANQLTNVLVVTFKDDHNIRVNVQFPEGSIVSPYRNTLPAGDSNLAAFAADVLDVGEIGAIGGWMRSRAGYPIANGRFGTCSQSRRLRKMRGYL